MATLTKSEIKERIDFIIIGIIDPEVTLLETIQKLMELSTNIAEEIHGREGSSTEADRTTG